MTQRIFAMMFGALACACVAGCGLSSQTGDGGAAGADSGATDSGTTDAAPQDASNDAAQLTDATLPLDAGGDAAVPTSCEALESTAVSQIEELTACNNDDQCEAVYNPFCGAQSSSLDSGCFLFRNLNVSPDGLIATARACAAQACVSGCLPADCDCSSPPSAACIGGRCVSSVSESDLEVCSPGEACIVVPYNHCCGATKRAIRADLLDAYNSHPEWQVFNEPSVCAVIGACLNDSAVTDATCADGRCSLVFP